MKTPAVALVTGAARRVGAAIACELHRVGYRVVLHCDTSIVEASRLCDTLNQRVPASASVVKSHLPTEGDALIERAVAVWDRLDVLVNNASAFYPATLADSTPAQWEQLMGLNAMAPFFLSQAAAPLLATHGVGNIVNIGDIHGISPLNGYDIYCQTKATLLMQTRVLAKELAPRVRVNAVSPGAVAWPEGVNTLSSAQQEKILAMIPLGRHGSPEDVAFAVRFLVREAGYMTGQTLVVDGGRSLTG